MKKKEKKKKKKKKDINRTVELYRTVWKISFLEYK